MRRSTRRLCTAAFTLVEMLVVIGIIAILAALLLPAVMSAINRARNAAIAIEINQLNSAVEAYRLDKGDYPPNFRNVDVVRRHIVKCYPRISPAYFIAFMKQVFPVDKNGDPINPTPPSSSSAGTVRVDEAQALVFWLSMTDKNPQFPFLSLPVTGFTGVAPDPKKYYDFDQTRLTTPAVLTIPPAFKARYCKDTFYLYIDSRSYDGPLSDPTDVCRFAKTDTSPAADNYAFSADDDPYGGVRPYWSKARATNPGSGTSALTFRDKNFKPANSTTFQIICAGQDGDFGRTESDNDAKVFPDGNGYSDGDKDNITNFSGGKTLGDAIP